MKDPAMPVLWWSRRDLRLTDNTALYHATQAADQVIPLYILDPGLIGNERNHGPRIAWMLDGLRMLAADLEKLGGRLIVRTGKPLDVLRAVVDESGATEIHFNRDYSPYALKRDGAIRAAFADLGVAVHDYKDLVIHEAHEVLSKGGSSYSVYSPFRKVWDGLPKPALLDRPTRLNTPSGLHSEPIPDAAKFNATPARAPIVKPGEDHALDRLEGFMNGTINDYDTARNIPGIDGSSRISPYLRWGMLSPRQAWWAAREAIPYARTPAARASIERWIGEIVWREFFYQVLARNPHVTNGAYRPECDRVPWLQNDDALQRWKDGQTGYPIVDAGMRQMNATGWMHNRLRMIVASFLCKDLLIDWRAGERYFMQRLLDGDLANNNGGWQWTAGTGTDAAPYFRIFNPTSQSEKFDPHGDYIREWVPELARVPTDYIHAPSIMPPLIQQASGCIIGSDYPAPIIAHDVQRERALAMYAHAKKSP